jgi:hypothetical protein
MNVSTEIDAEDVIAHESGLVSDRLRRANAPDRKLDEAVARALGFRIVATTRGPHIMREGAVASWDLPAYTATAESREDAIQKLRARDVLA